MVRTRSRLENLSKEELNEELIVVDDISTKISELSNRINDFLKRFEVLSSDLVKSRFKHFRGFHRFALPYEFTELVEGRFSYLSEKTSTSKG